MSREASTSVRTEEIILNLLAPNIQAIAYLEVDINGSWNIVDDLDWDKGINWTEAGKKEKYANFALTPLPGTINFSVVNTDGKYFPGSTDSLAGVFDLDTKVRLKAGYVLDSGSETTQTLNLNDISGQYIKSYFYRTEHSAGTVILDSDGTQSITHFQDVFDNLYDQGAYDSDNYTPDAYTVQTYDSSQPGLEQFNSFTVTANNTGGTIYYRTFDDPNILGVSDSTNWTSAGATVNGTKTVDFTDIEYERFIQVAILYDGISWGDNNIISDISVTIESRFEQLYTSVYYLDSPKFSDPKAPAQPIVQCSGRDAFKRAIGVDVNYSSVGGEDIDDIIKSICDKVGISYTATSIADLSGFGTRTAIVEGADEPVKAEKIFEHCMQIINPTGYVMYTEYDSATDNNVLFVQERPSLADTTGAFSYKNYESIGSMSKNAGKILQRITALTKTNIVNPDEELDTRVITTTGNKSLSWATSTGENAEYKRIVVDYPENITISNLSVNPNSLTFTVDSINGVVNVTAYGNRWSSEAPIYEGEAIDWDNMTLLNGVTARLENPLFKSDAECKSVAESFITQFGTPIFQAGSLKWPYMNLIPELNDGYLLWRRFVGGTSADDIYITTKASHHFDKNNHYTTFNLDDSGSNYSDLGDFIYDDVMDWDKGYVWDMGVSTPLSTDAEIDAASTIVHNVSFS
jgi:hypothetical protein